MAPATRVERRQAAISTSLIDDLKMRQRMMAYGIIVTRQDVITSQARKHYDRNMNRGKKLFKMKAAVVSTFTEVALWQLP
jgi:hypothetical protein